jgi:hypothetical protein
MILDPRVATQWIIATLLATEGATTRVNGAVVPADAVALVENRIYPLTQGDGSKGEGSIEPEGWPYIVVSGEGDYERVADEISLARGDYAIRMVMREDMLAAVDWNGDIEDYTILGYYAIAAAFDNAEAPDPASGIVHGCRILRPYIRLYGEPRRKISEMGVVARIEST